MVDGCIMNLRKHPRVGYGIPIIIAIEACNADATYIGPMFLEHNMVEKTIFVMAEFPGKTSYGVQKNNRITTALVTATITLLSMRLITIPDDVICYSTNYCQVKATIRDYISALMMNFSNFKLDQETGKMHGKSGGNNDDKLVSFMMPLFWSTKFCANINPDYLDFKERFDPIIWLNATARNIIHNGLNCGNNDTLKSQQQQNYGFYDY